ncbi:MAG TPA: glycosyltransferase [Aequorivita sp.]|nr:glycosyltransferase [Aequorivita sp.]
MINQKSNPLLSIVIPCYNMGAYIKEAVDSISTFQNSNKIELIIVNDGSTQEETLRVLEELEKEGFCVLHQENEGLAMARNNGIALSKGDYIIPLDADNKIRPEFISTAIETFSKNNDVDIIYSDAAYFGEKTGRWTVGKFHFPKLLMANYIDACACYKRSVWEKLGGYDKDMPVMGSEDWDFWLRAHLKGFNFIYIPEILFDYRVRTDSMVANTKRNGSLIAEYMFKKPELANFKEVRNYIWKLTHNKNRNDELPNFKELIKLFIVKLKSILKK